MCGCYGAIVHGVSICVLSSFNSVGAIYNSVSAIYNSVSAIYDSVGAMVHGVSKWQDNSIDTNRC